MYDEASLYAYWQCGLQQQMLRSLTAEQLEEHGRHITRAECEDGQLTQQHLIKKLTANGDIMAILPYNMSFILLIKLQDDGTFTVVPHLALPIFLGTETESLENFMVVEPPPWTDELVTITWQQQLQYATQALNSIDPAWSDNVWEHAKLFPITDLCPEIKMDISLLKTVNKITLIEAARNSGKSSYAKKFIVNSWIDAAVRGIPAPRHVWCQHNQAVHYATIFACCKVVDTQYKAVGDARAEFIKLHTLYIHGKKNINNWRDIANRIKTKYSGQDGIYTRVNQLQSNLKEIKLQLRHLQVLQAIWLHQLELLPKWSKRLDFIPCLESRRLQRLHLFFKQNFPEQNTVNLNQVQFEQLFNDTIRRVESSERFAADALHQVESDLQQEQLIKDKCLSWCQQQGIFADNIETVQQSITNIWPQVIEAAVNYWHEYFIMHPDELLGLSKTPDDIDTLIVEHAEYVSPMQAAQLLAISKRAIIMGNYNPICAPRFAVHIDYELTKYYGLASCDADFEDLQFDGNLASLGSMWNLAAQGHEVDKVLQPHSTKDISYAYIDTIELSDIQITLEWLLSNDELAGQVIIYTCFSTHALKLRAALQNTQFANITIRLVQDPCFDKSNISLFLPVYTINDPGPYVFDRGCEIIDNLIANTMQRLVVIGDMRIFKPELHSAAGKLAKHLLLQEKEVNCVGV